MKAIWENEEKTGLADKSLSTEQLSRDNPQELISIYKAVRGDSEKICEPLQIEDYVVQPVVDVSPPKWHLGHTTWFFETFLLKMYLKNYEEYDPDYNYVFNSYYESVGARVIRTDRGNLSRPPVSEVYEYRAYVDAAMVELLSGEIDDEIKAILLLGFNHEQQHQELLYSDIKYILGHNPLFPAYNERGIEHIPIVGSNDLVSIEEGVHEIGYAGKGFCFDNERQRHKVYLQGFQIANQLVTNGEFLEFIQSGGYQDFRYWHSEGWEWVKTKDAKSPLYWHSMKDIWYTYTLRGLQEVDLKQPVTHINYYEATAFAQWKEMRLPTEAEWEIAAPELKWGQRWE